MPLPGETAQPSLSLLCLLPDPYSLARSNSYYWTAKFLDSDEDRQVRGDNLPENNSEQGLAHSAVF